MVHILTAIRSAIKSKLDAAAVEVEISGTPTPVLNLLSPPSGSNVDDEDLPAFFVFTDGETISRATNTSNERAIRVAIYLFAHSKADPQDQLDEMQLQIEIALAGDHTLGGLCYELNPVAMSAAQEQGRVVFGARTLEYRCVTNVTANNPSV